MPYRNVLVPYDGSEYALHALHTAMELVAPDPRARLCVLTVIPPSDARRDRGFEEGDDAPGAMDYEEYHRETSVVTDHARRSLEDDVRIELDMLGEKGSVDAVASTTVARGIAGYAAMNGYDLIVMGRRGFKSARGKVGTVCSEVLAGTDLPVLTVR